MFKITEKQKVSEVQNAANNYDETISKTITDAGKTVTILVRCMYGEDEIEEMGEDRWELSIAGKGGQCTHWSNWYPSADKALQRGMAAVLEEGIDAFYDCPEFDYMPDWINPNG